MNATKNFLDLFRYLNNWKVAPLNRYFSDAFLPKICAKWPVSTISIPSALALGYDGVKRKKDAKVHMAIDTLDHLLALHVTPANEQDRSQAGKLVRAVQEKTCASVEIAFVDQGYTGETAANEASEHGVELHVVKLPEAKRGFVLLPHRWVVERALAGPLASDVWPEMTRSCHRLWLGYITWRLPC